MNSEKSPRNGSKSNGTLSREIDFEAVSHENQRLLAEIRDLQHSNREYRSVIYHISHDLNWPLNNIISLINLMMDTTDPEEMRTLSLPVLKSITNFKESMNDILKLNGPENDSGKEGLLSIKTVLTDVLDSINGQFLHSGAVLSHSFQVTHLRFPKKKLRSILFNLVSNAIKYKSPDRISTIHVSTYTEGEFVVLSVIDNGKGIPPQKMHKLFTKFGTLHQESYPGESLGIGLFLLKKLVEEVSGKIEVESDWGKGSAFKVYLPQETTLPTIEEPSGNG